MNNRDDKHLIHFKSRSNRDKFAPKSLLNKKQSFSPLKKKVLVDRTQLGSQVTTEKFMHVGTSPVITQDNQLASRRILQQFMKSGDFKPNLGAL